MPERFKTAFLPRILQIPIKSLAPTREFEIRERRHAKYRQIAASIESIGLIEPLVVFSSSGGKYKILDGRKRFDVLVAKGVSHAECIVATVDEAYTYNRRTNYLSPVGEHEMILRALKHNSEAAVAAALNVEVDTIRRKRDLLNGICPEAARILQDHRATPRAFAALRKMKPTRQIEVAEVMVASGTFTGAFVDALLAGTSDDLLLKQTEHPDRASRINSQDSSRLRFETDKLLKNAKAVQDSYGTDVLTLSVAARYVERLLANTAVQHYLESHHSEMLSELKSLQSGDS